MDESVLVDLHPPRFDHDRRRLKVTVAQKYGVSRRASTR
jgi:hypothetical protein